MAFKHIKTRINTKTKAGEAAKKIGGLSVSQLQSALKGDTRLLKHIGSMAKEGEMAKLLMPAIFDALKVKIENERDWNTFLAEYVDSGSKAELSIEAAQQKASLANAKYVHGKKELNEQFKINWELEKGRHKYAIDYNRAKAFADLVFQQVDGQVRVLEQNSRIDLRQLEEDRKYHLQEAQHVLQHGDESSLENIHKRKYALNGANSPRLWKRFLNVLGV